MVVFMLTRKTKPKKPNTSASPSRFSKFDDRCLIFRYKQLHLSWSLSAFTGLSLILKLLKCDTGSKDHASKLFLSGRLLLSESAPCQGTCFLSISRSQLVSPEVRCFLLCICAGQQVPEYQAHLHHQQHGPDDYAFCIFSFCQNWDNHSQFAL